MSQQAVSDPPTGVPSPSSTTTQTLEDLHLDNLASTFVLPSSTRDFLYLLSEANPFFSVVYWWGSYVFHIILSLLFSPSSILFDPLSFVAAVAIYPVIGSLLTAYATFLFFWRPFAREFVGGFIRGQVFRGQLSKLDDGSADLDNNLGKAAMARWESIMQYWTRGRSVANLVRFSKTIRHSVADDPPPAAQPRHPRRRSRHAGSPRSAPLSERCW